MRNRTLYNALTISCGRLLTLVASCCFACLASAQTADSNPLVEQYQKARVAYIAKQYEEASTLFQNVAELCAGSELAIQCEYFSLMSDWTLQPSEETATQLASWIDNSKEWIAKARAAGHSTDTSSLDNWIDNAQLLCAKWDRLQKRQDKAETRLRSLLENRSAASSQGIVSASAWLELGSMLLHDRAQYPEADRCFRESMTSCGQNIANDSAGNAILQVQNQAAFGLAVVNWHQGNMEEAKQAVSKLNPAELDADLAIQVRLLRSKLAAASRDIATIASELEPAVEIALAGNPTALALYELAIALLEAGDAPKSDSILAQIVQRFPEAPIAVEARVRLAQRAVEQRKWADAIPLAEQAIQQGCSPELLPHAQLALGQSLLETGRSQAALSALETIPLNETLALDLQLSIRFQLGESLYQLERWPEAERHWRWLLELAKQVETETKKSPPWLSKILLRKAELLAFQREWKQAEEIVLRIRQDFPECNHRSEVDYLLARCLISRAEFDEARNALELVSKRLNATSSQLLARTHWMAGETYMMQRRYDQAQIQYEKVLQVPDQKYWHAAALLQIGQCCEASQDPKTAHDAYSRIIEQFSDSPFVTLARERLAVLPSKSIAQQPEFDSSGTKR